ncbi:hypothetical protein GRJ2_001423400 [Grus japonensis]|uniref:Uncharacterized protein n=1 Tax=Grus japonensis TaxID=30415 RepID=A0ABC9WVY6_GRUJA
MLFPAAKSFPEAWPGNQAVQDPPDRCDSLLLARAAAEEAAEEAALTQQRGARDSGASGGLPSLDLAPAGACGCPAARERAPDWTLIL